MPKTAHSGWPPENHEAGVSIKDVVPTIAVAARPGPIRPVSRATSRPASNITATRIPYDASARTSGSRRRFPARATRPQVTSRQAGTMCVLCGTSRLATVRSQVREAATYATSSLKSW